MDTDPMEDRVDHTLAAQATTIDLICMSSSRSDSEYGREVYMVDRVVSCLRKPLKSSNGKPRKR
jgi:hypothetical protein